MLPVPEGLREKLKVTANIIGIIENQAPTNDLRLEVPFRNGQVYPDIREDIAKVAVIERHQRKGVVQMGLVDVNLFRFLAVLE